MSKRYINIVDTAKLIRAALKDTFPGVKFAVRASKYSMGSNIDVSWTDGPSTRAVEAITDQYYGTGFDSMTDCTTHHDSTLNGETVHFSGSRPHLNRDITPELEAKMARVWDTMESRHRVALLNRHDFPRWPEDRPGYRLASYLNADGTCGARQISSD